MPSAVSTIIPLSGSAGGRGIKVTQTTLGAAITIHTPLTAITDEIEILAAVCDPVTAPTGARLTILWGGSTDPDDKIHFDVPAGAGLVLVYRGIIAGDGVRTVLAYASVANVISVHGRVNRLQ